MPFLPNQLLQIVLMLLPGTCRDKLAIAWPIIEALSLALCECFAAMAGATQGLDVIPGQICPLVHGCNMVKLHQIISRRGLRRHGARGHADTAY